MKSKESIFKFVDIEDDFSLTNLRNRKLICKYFDGFNDPYEGHFGVDTIWPCPYKETEKLRELISSLAPEYADINTASRKHMIEYIRKNSHMADFTLTFINNEARKYRLCSFTRRWNHLLMWAHYSNGNRGAVLIFNQNELLKDSKTHLLNSTIELNGQHMPIGWVDYQTLPPLINSVDVFESVKVPSEILTEKITNEIYKKCMLTKSIKWKYEQESRLILKFDGHMEQQPVFYKYSPKALTGVIIGNKCSRENIHNIANSVGDNVNIFLTKQNQSKYKFEPYETYNALDFKSGRVDIKIIK